MFAYGAGECRPADLVTGPGNIWVTAAKRMLKGVIGIDSEAGPTEVAVLADDTADPAHVAADLISQAEHDTIAASVLVTDSESLADAVDAALAVQVAATKHAERITEALAGSQSGIVLVDDLEAGLRVVDLYAAEHLEIHTRDAREVAMRVRNAGAIFVGTYAPVSLGDYAAGSNHVLPTGGSAAHSSGLSVQSFLRGIHVVEYDEHALRDVAPHVVALAQAEDLPAHAAAIGVRVGPRRRARGRGRPMTRIDDLPVRPELRGQVPYGAPQLDVPVLLNVNENPYPPSASLVADLADAVAAVATGLNRYPDRDAVALRADLARYLDPDARLGLTAANVWAANGSNEVMLQLMQAFGGPGRSALAFSPTYSMYPDYCRDTSTRYLTEQRRDDFGIDARRRRRRRAAAPAGRGAAGLAEQPDRDRAAVRRRRGRPRRRRGDRGRRRGLRRVPAAGHAIGAGAAAGPSPAGGDAHHVEGVRPRRRAGRLPRRGPRGGRRGPARAPAVPPVGGHPGRRPDCVAPRPGSCRPWSTTCAASGTTWWCGCAAAGTRSRSPMPTSCCSAGSRTATRSGRGCSTGGC